MKAKKDIIIKNLKIVGKTILTILIVAFLLMVFLQRFSNNRISFFNLRMFTVVSGSMKPRYNIGDVLISKSVDPSKIKIGDTISYLGTKGDFKDKVITHEVVGIELDASGKYLFHSQGLVSIVEDPIVHESQLYGKVIYKPIILSFVYKIIGTKYGLFILVIIPLLYIIGSEIISSLLAKEEERRNKA